jgi:hypothetical protein
VSFLSLEDAIQAARLHIRTGRDIQEFFSFYQVPPDWQQEIRTAVEPVILIDETRSSETWVSRLSDEDWYYWNRLKIYLSDDKKWERKTVASIGNWSSNILQKIPDPRLARFRGQGLVIGYVQAGKTANYTALSARAADAGFRLIIVLSGIHNSLREQTQGRLDQELTGEVPPEKPTVGKPEYGKQWYRVTDIETDFDAGIGPEILQSSQPKLAVMKKICPILEKLDNWLTKADPEALSQTPVLIIDDEADQASVNTGGDRPLADNEDGYVYDIESEDQDTSPSRTNDLIRRILNKLPRVSYVGYTATPFANVLIDPHAVDAEVGRDLFPKDFVLQLPKPDSYTGTRELFGSSTAEGRDALRIVPGNEADVLRQKPNRRFEPFVTQSLEDAINDFLLAGAVRKVRGQVDDPNTMLVHTTHRTEGQGRIVKMLKDYTGGMLGEWKYTEGDASIKKKLLERWSSEYRAAVDENRLISETDLVEHLGDVIGALEVLELNSVAGDELDYESRPGRQIIAVGGNRLSRGLTLEGLTVSYFLRTSTMCDTLLQMGRWFGHRRGFEDLIRIYTTKGLTTWFAELAVIEEDLRDEIDRLNASGSTPEEIGVRIRSHSSLILTSRLKMKNGDKIKVGYSGDHPQTIVFPLDDIDALNSNVSLTRRLFQSTPFLRTRDGLMARGVSSEQILEFLTSYEYSPESRTISSGHLTNWIRDKNKSGYLKEWTVYIPHSSDARHHIDFAGERIGMPTRSRLPYSMSIGTLVDPRHEAADLPGGAEDYKRPTGTYDAVKMRKARPPENGLLIIYPIDPASEHHKKRVRLFEDEWDKPEAVIGFCLSFPFIDGDEGADYIVGRQWS